ncbi:benzoate-CoA ligase family protein [Peribacillus butanolivorans]|uniref:benzoate-CoA ligase family protein n=1 Tax=Peribacillus butanolivorans TaxID=421767 RepID=UPI00369957FD
MIKTEHKIRGLGARYNASYNFFQKNIEVGRGDKAAIYYEDRFYTYQEIDTSANQFGAALKELNIEMEQRVLLLLHDSPEFIISFFGAIKVGAIPIPANTLLPLKDYEFLLNNSRSKVLVTTCERWEELKVIKNRLLFLKHVILVDGENQPLKEADEHSFHNLIKGKDKELPPCYSNINDQAFWLYTSGSTGEPKGVIHLQTDMEEAFKNYAKNILQITENDITFSASKLFFAYGLGNGMYFPLGAGATTVLMPDRPTAEKVFETIEKYRPTIFFGVPTLYGSMLNYLEKTKKNYDLSSIRLCVSAGEALPASYIEQWKNVFNIDIIDGIGSTESLHIYLSNQVNQIRQGSTGKVVPGYEAKIVDEDGQEAAVNEVGDLLIKGESIAASYWNLNEENKQKFIGDWLVTGDKYFKDEDGFYWYAGRIDDMMKVNGIWVSPIEIENALLSHPDILETAVVAVNDENNLIKPKAYIVLKAGVEPREELKLEFKGFIKKVLAPYKYPRVIEFVNELPKTTTGKIQRFKLRD